MAYKDPFDERNREARRKHYRNNKQQYLDRNQNKKEELRNFLRAVKSYPCEDCGVGYPYWIMQFDHRPEEDKLYAPARLHALGSWYKTVEEVMKCDVVCANCHADRTHKRICGYGVMAAQRPPTPLVRVRPFVSVRRASSTGM
jgi:hypothetical protein